MLAGMDAGTGVRGHEGVRGGGAFLPFSPTVWAGSGGERRDTHRNTHTQRNVHANVAPTLLATYPAN